MRAQTQETGEPMADRYEEPTPYRQEAYDPRSEQPTPQWPVPGGAQPQDSGYTAPLPSHLAPATTTTTETPTMVSRRPRRRSFVGDVTAGLFLGDFATDLGMPGAVTQVVVSFVPLIGSTCAVRDLVADLRHHDHVGATLNFLALTPILGGFSKTFEVIRSTAHVGHAMHVSHQQAERRNEEEASLPSAARSRRGRERG